MHRASSMKVVIDTTVLGRDSTLSASDGQLLRVFLERTQSELCIPRVVAEEAVNLVRKSVAAFNKAAQEAARLSRDRKTFFPVDVEAKVAEYRDRLDAEVRACKGRILELPAVSHERLLSRTLSNRKPFVDGGRGYKDTLIWFTILELMESCDDEICFISTNYKDWARENDHNLLHISLWEDLSRFKVNPTRVHLVESLSEFNRQYTIKDLPEPSADEVRPEPNYRQILLDGHDLVKTEMPSALAGLLQVMSNFEVNPDPVTLLSLSLPTGIEHHVPPRLIDAGRRVLQFSAGYTATVEFRVPTPRLPSRWNQFSFHLVQDQENNAFVVHATLRVRASFHMIQDGENTERFSFGISTDTSLLESLKVG